MEDDILEINKLGFTVQVYQYNVDTIQEHKLNYLWDASAKINGGHQGCVKFGHGMTAGEAVADLLAQLQKIACAATKTIEGAVKEVDPFDFGEDDEEDPLA